MNLFTSLADNLHSAQIPPLRSDELVQFRNALDQHSIVAITDVQGRITYANDKFCAISQYSREELLGQDHRLINSNHHPKEFFRDLWTTIGQGRRWQADVRNRAKDGSYYWVATTIVPIVGTEGKPTHFMAIRNDISDRKRDEQRLAALTQSLSETNKELEGVLQAVTHDLRAPLVNIQAFGREIRAMVAGPVANAAMETSAPPRTDMAELINLILRNAAKMNMLLSGLLRYSRLGQAALHLTRLDMNALVNQTARDFECRLKRIGADLRVKSLPDCLGDATQIGEVVAILIDNAIKYRDPDRPPVIEISGTIEGGRSLYRVEDNGIGIPPKQHHRIFEILQRLNTNSETGAGMGLSTARRIVRRHDGSIRVESKPGQGSAFVVNLLAPLAPLGFS